MITVRHHKGHSGKSVFAWRVYREGLLNGIKPYRTQLAKYRTQEAAEKAADHYRANDSRTEAARRALGRAS
jgi:hypothetical protein